MAYIIRNSRTDDQIIDIRCDVCRYEIDTNEIPDDWNIFNSVSDEQFDLIGRIGRIGGPTIYQICSPECFETKIRNLISELKEAGNPKIAGMSVPFAKRLLQYMNRN